jgi:hypothetical protein
MKYVFTIAVFTLGLVACGIFNGPATSNLGDKCQGHYDCTWACCVSANQDGEGWSCNPPGSSSVCEYIGLTPDPNGLAGKKNPKAGRLKPPDPNPS